MIHILESLVRIGSGCLAEVCPLLDADLKHIPCEPLQSSLRNY